MFARNSAQGDEEGQIIVVNKEMKEYQPKASHWAEFRFVSY